MERRGYHMDGQFKKRKRIITAFAVFLAFMWLFTMISKSVYASGLPYVRTTGPVKKFVEHSVSAEGMVVQGGEQAVTALEGLRVDNIFVHTGDRVEEGTPLFQVDLDDLKEIMKEMETEILKTQYRITDLKTNQALEAQKKQIEEQRAREDYSETDEKTGTTAGRAESAKSDADSSLQDHLNDQVSITSEQDRQKAWDKYNQWVKNKNELIGKIEELEKQITEMESPPSEESDDEGSLADTGEMTEEENTELDEAKKKLQTLREDLSSHVKNEVSMPDFSGEDSALESWKSNVKALEDAAESAEYSLEDAYKDRDSALKEAGRKVDDTLLPGQADSTLTIYEMELADLKAKLSKYQGILKNEGNINAETGGIVTDIQISAGGRTPGTAAILLTDDSVPCQFKVVLDKEQKKYVKLGDTVSVKLDRSNADFELTVDYLKESNGGPGTYEAYLNLPADTGIPGMSGVLEATVTGESYENCIPVESLHEENKNYYVYVVKERDGILGKELYAERVSVQILDQNNRYAAIEGGVLDKESAVITSLSEVINRGDVVRYEE